MTCVGAWRVAPAGDEPIEQHADGGEVLLYGRLRHSLLERLYIGGDVERLDIDQHHDPSGVQPGKKIGDGPIIGHAGVLVTDGGGKNSRKRRSAVSPAPAIAAGTTRPRRPWRAVEGVRAPRIGTI